MKPIINTVILSFLVFVPNWALADLGDTLEAARIKYGESSTTGSAKILAYHGSKYRVWQTYSNGICVIAEFSLLNHGPLTLEDCRELDRNNLPGLTPRSGPGWDTVPWPDNAHHRDTVSFQYTMKCEGRTIYYQVITGQFRREDNVGWYYSRMYLSAAGIQTMMAL
jgi:hypothetical protein